MIEHKLRQVQSDEPPSTPTAIYHCLRYCRGKKIEFLRMWDLYWPTMAAIHPADFVRASMSIPIFFRPILSTMLPADWAPEQVKAYRRQDAVHILENLYDNLQVFLSKTLLKSPLGNAITYTLKRWEKLCIYVSNGILQIDNNLVENSIRLVALGRKNYLFAGNHERAQDAAMLYSLFATCTLHNINPAQWLNNLFEKINSTPKEQLHLLLPQNYTPPVVKQ